GDGFLTFVHHVVHELGDDEVPELRVGKDLALLCATAAGHSSSSLLRTLRAVERTTLLAVLDPLGVENAAQDVVANARKVLHPAATGDHAGALLHVLAFAGYVAHGFDARGHPHLGVLPQGGGRLLRGRTPPCGRSPRCG